MNSFSQNCRIAIVGAGPAGLITAIGIKKRAPHAQVVCYEKHSEYQRIHHARLSASAFKGAPADPGLDRLRQRLQESGSLRTSELEGELHQIATRLGVEMRYRHVQLEPVSTHPIAQKAKPQNSPPLELATLEAEHDLIIGADGTHSQVRQAICGNARGFDLDLRYVAQVKYQVAAPAQLFTPKQIESLCSQPPAQRSSRGPRGRLPGIYYRFFDSKTPPVDGRTEVSLRFFITKRAYEKLRRPRAGGRVERATFKHPLIKGVDDHEIPGKLRCSIESLLAARREQLHERNEQVPIEITGFKLNTSASACFATQRHGKVYCLVGDAALASSFFHGLYNGTRGALWLSESIAEMISGSGKRGLIKRIQNCFWSTLASILQVSSRVDPALERYAVKIWWISQKELIRARLINCALRILDLLRYWRRCLLRSAHHLELAPIPPALRSGREEALVTPLIDQPETPAELPSSRATPCTPFGAPPTLAKSSLLIPPSLSTPLQPLSSQEAQKKEPADSQPVVSSQFHPATAEPSAPQVARTLFKLPSPLHAPESSPKIGRTASISPRASPLQTPLSGEILVQPLALYSSHLEQLPPCSEAEGESSLLTPSDEPPLLSNNLTLEEVFPSLPSILSILQGQLPAKSPSTYPQAFEQQSLSASLPSCSIPT